MSCPTAEDATRISSRLLGQTKFIFNKSKAQLKIQNDTILETAE